MIEIVQERKGIYEEKKYTCGLCPLDFCPSRAAFRRSLTDLPDLFKLVLQYDYKTSDPPDL